METMNPKEIKTHPTFESLFPINREVLARIEKDLRNGYYDDSQPIILGTWEGLPHSVVLDGHTRLKAFKNAGLEFVYVCEYEFNTEQDALDHAIRLQTHRRNLSDADLIQCIQVIHQQRPRGGDRRSEQADMTPQLCGKNNGRSAAAKETAEMLNICPRKVEQALTVIKYGKPEVKEAVLKNEMSVNKAYQETQAQRKKAKSEATEPAKEEVKNSEEPPTPATAEHAAAESTGHVNVRIPELQYRALRELGEPIERHLELAIEIYLKMAADDMEQASNNFQIPQAV